MCAVMLAVGKDDNRFTDPGCIDVVVAANAGETFSALRRYHHPDGMGEGSGQLSTFFLLFVPAVVNFVLAATIMQFASCP